MSKCELELEFVQCLANPDYLHCISKLTRSCTNGLLQ